MIIAIGELYIWLFISQPGQTQRAWSLIGARISPDDKEPAVRFVLSDSLFIIKFDTSDDAERFYLSIVQAIKNGEHYLDTNEAGLGFNSIDAEYQPIQVITVEDEPIEVVSFPDQPLDVLVKNDVLFVYYGGDYGEMVSGGYVNNS